MKYLSWVIGMLFGGVISLIAAWLIMYLGQMLAGGITSFWGEPWLYYSIVFPSAVTFSILAGYLYNKSEAANKKLWLISLCCAFIVSWYSGTIGAIFAEFLIRGTLEPINGASPNIEGILIWGTIYAFLFLPITTAVFRFLIDLLRRLLQRVQSL
ncbi:hypothetical protein [Bacillus litorisediminis]|uniref:hypothetical protein n=1 Tax=Bacillus litorisediminis TaxID=2922713 RepID=UPI001FABE581|nr:hypothetical protein [Bacillus litorisediminis]